LFLSKRITIVKGIKKEMDRYIIITAVLIILAILGFYFYAGWMGYGPFPS
jgi:hypothetical protein